MTRSIDLHPFRQQSVGGGRRRRRGAVGNGGGGGGRVRAENPAVFIPPRLLLLGFAAVGPLSTGLCEFRWPGRNNGPSSLFGWRWACEPLRANGAAVYIPARLWPTRRTRPSHRWHPRKTHIHRVALVSWIFNLNLKLRIRKPYVLVFKKKKKKKQKRPCLALPRGAEQRAMASSAPSCVWEGMDTSHVHGHGRPVKRRRTLYSSLL